MVKISNRWSDDDAWQFHIENKTIIRQFSEDRKCDKLKMLSGVIIKEEWKHFDKPEEEPPNIDMIRNCIDAITTAMDNGTLKVPKLQRIFLKKLMDVVASLYLQDSAYLERLGGVMTLLLANEPKWHGKLRVERKKALEGARVWWNTNDERERTRAMIDNVWACFLLYYTKKKWFADVVDFGLDWFAERKEEWKVANLFNPAEWYPKKRGAVQNMVMGGMG